MKNMEQNISDVTSPAEKAVWTAPELIDLNNGLGDVLEGIAPGVDGTAGGPSGGGAS